MEILIKLIVSLVCVRCSESARQNKTTTQGSPLTGLRTGASPKPSALANNVCVPLLPIPKVIRVASLPGLYLTSSGNASAGVRPSGYFIDLLDEIEKITGIPYTFTTVGTGHSYGQKLPNGSFDGLVGELLGNRADLIGLGLVNFKERNDVIDFLVPIVQLKVQVLFNPSFGLTDKTDWGVRTPSVLRLTCAATNTSAKEVCAKIKASKLGFLEKDDGVARVVAGNFAFLGGTDVFDLDMLRENEGKVVTQDILTTFLGMAVQKNSLLRNYLNDALLQIIENGDLQKLNVKYGYPS